MQNKNSCRQSMKIAFSKECGKRVSSHEHREGYSMLVLEIGNRTFRFLTRDLIYRTIMSMSMCSIDEYDKIMNAQGLKNTQGLITELKKVNSLSVALTTKMSIFKEMEKSHQDIAKKLKIYVNEND
ncbi:MAG: hypothetical protein LBI81_00360 [Puniceicoccales bacterium]|nr:hypothetical protein [Puniceicoccales bacterium]